MQRKYARVERERRFVLSELPRGIDAESFQRFEDLYIAGTHVRLRLVYSATGEFLSAKLGQKVPCAEDPEDPRLRSMTTLYLPWDEAQPFAALDGLRGCKRRYHLQEQGRTFCIDVYEAPDAALGVLVAEVECDDMQSLEAIVCPVWATREVTADPRYSAVALLRGALR